MRLTKNQFLKAFAATVVLLAVVRAVFPSIAKPADAKKKTETKGQDARLRQAGLPAVAWTPFAQPLLQAWQAARADAATVNR